MNKLDELWTEEDLIKRFYLPSKGGKSRQIGKWVAKGLKCIRLSDRRFFREEDVVKFLNEQQLANE